MRQDPPASRDEPGVVRVRDGHRVTLGAFLETLAKRRGQPITALTDQAQISRAYYYLLRDDRQTPSIETLANLLGALGADFRFGTPTDDADFVVSLEDDEWLIRLGYEGRRAARARTVRAMTYAASPQPDSAMPEAAPPPRAASARGGRTFVVAAGSTDSRTPRQAELLSQLVEAAGKLDEERLEALVRNAQLFAKGGEA